MNNVDFMEIFYAFGHFYGHVQKRFCGKDTVLLQMMMFMKMGARPVR